jgi:hypothetical protein
MTNLETTLLETLDGGSNSLVAIAVGTAEGTRTPIGSFTSAWWGHTDPVDISPALKGRGFMNSRNFKGAVKSPLHTQNNYPKVMQLCLLLFFCFQIPSLSQIGTLPTLPLLALFALPSFRRTKWPGSLRTRKVQHVDG